jgi:ParB family chromosome partitioning protein
MLEAGYKRKIICDALTVDKTVISRMLAIVEVLPQGLIEAIGAAPGVGRGRWIALASLIEKTQMDPEALQVAASFSDAPSSDARFEAVYAALEKRAKPPAPVSAAEKQSRTLLGADGEPIGAVQRSPRGTTLKFTAQDGFEDWLLTHLPELHRQWRDEEESPETGQ